MTPNPILEELYAIREQLLADADGNCQEYLAGVREREAASGRLLVRSAGNALEPVKPKVDRPQDILARFEELKLLKDGWLGGVGRAPSHEGLDWLASVMAAKYPDELPLPFAYPIAEGGVQLEWASQPASASLEVDLGEKTGQWHALDNHGAEDEERSLDLRDDASWEWVLERLAEIVGTDSDDR